MVSYDEETPETMRVHMYGNVAVQFCDQIDRVTHTQIYFFWVLVSNYSLHASHVIGIVAELDSILVCMHANFPDFLC